MSEKITRHRAERGDAFETVEEPLRIDRAVREHCVLDCVPLWLNNLFFQGREAEADEILGSLLRRLPSSIVIVTNEIGMGVIPMDPMTRRYGEALGRINARLAAAVDRVELMVAGLPLRVK